MRACMKTFFATCKWQNFFGNFLPRSTTTCWRVYQIPEKNSICQANTSTIKQHYWNQIKIPKQLLSFLQLVHWSAQIKVTNYWRHLYSASLFWSHSLNVLWFWIRGKEWFYKSDRDIICATENKDASILRDRVKGWMFVISPSFLSAQGLSPPVPQAPKIHVLLWWRRRKVIDHIFFMNIR